MPEAVVDVEGPQPAWFQSGYWYVPIVRYARVSICVVSVILPSASAPVPVTSLYVDPGAYCSLIAWFRSGRPGVLRMRS